MYSTAYNLWTYTWFVHFELPFRLKGTEKIHTERFSKFHSNIYSILYGSTSKTTIYFPLMKVKGLLLKKIFLHIHRDCFWSIVFLVKIVLSQNPITQRVNLKLISESVFSYVAIYSGHLYDKFTNYIDYIYSVKHIVHIIYTYKYIYVNFTILKEKCLLFLSIFW